MGFEAVTDRKVWRIANQLGKPHAEAECLKSRCLRDAARLEVGQAQSVSNQAASEPWPAPWSVKIKNIQLSSESCRAVVGPMTVSV